jgi:hypothetical protein
MTITSTELGATGRYINLGSDASQDDTPGQTWIIYCKPTSVATASYLFSKVSIGSTNGLRFYLQTPGGGVFTLGFGAHSTGASGAPSKITIDSFALSNWYHLQATWDGSLTASTGIQMYVDGGSALANTPTNTNGATAVATDATYDLFLMNRGGSANLAREFIGSVAYWARWNRVLDSTERANVRDNGPLAESNGLILCWANDQDYGTSTLTATARSTRVTGDTPTNDALGDTASGVPATTRLAMLGIG